MTTVGYSTLEIIPSLKGFRQKLEQGTAADMTAVGKSGGRRFGDSAGDAAGKSFKGKFGNAMRGFSPLGGLAAGAGVATLFSDVIGQASEAQQAVGGVQAVFKDYAASVIGDSNRASQSLGLSATAYQQLVTVSGALLKNKGLRDFAEQSENLVTIGADLAAQFGGSTQQAVEALNAALRGESDPIERYAISLNETAVKAKLAAEGSQALTGAALEQAKTQARLSLIIEQSADAQGAFARESNTLAGQQARVTAEWANMRAELGTRLLPALTGVVGTVNGEVLPALSGAGSVVGDLAGAFGDLPGPIKSTALALGAIRLAAASGVTGRLATFGASLRDIKTNSDGARASLKSLGKQAGVAALAVGALEIFQNLQPDGAAVDRYVEKLQALSGPDIQGQIASITSEIEKQQKVVSDAFGPQFSVFGTRVAPLEFGEDWKEAAARVDALKEQLAQLKHQQELDAIASSKGSVKMGDYANSLGEARSAVLGLLGAENKRRDASAQDRRDRIALLDTLAAARQEARDGKQTLDENTDAGRRNLSALLDLADQWNQSAPKVRNARGAYGEMREQFIALADKMNGPDGPRRAAVRLAEELLALPKRRAIEIETPGMDKALADLKRLQDLASQKQAHIISIKSGVREAFASGGLVGGIGSGTSDSNLAWLSRGEFVQRKASVDYYGTEFMRKLNALQIPRLAGGGQVAPAGRPSIRTDQTFGPIYVQAHDYDDFMRQLGARTRRRALGGVPIGRG